ncbi:3-deoxy-D-manno-octulosonic acid transferase [Vibrio tapetis subsp. quintayensis]|uniref:3-deoxy-D-manno-octulosonic acid transferase n=1 Tax=Vibrio tapetis TaxID=52443 RepID=UPI0025B61B70|nr:3-deoxy-D-manno-octulosonic acid transferase [Vibrio tapetis]MDN3679508.1 3-deoxy-D-manno-octulosonic acid transferase [Vibrio tapetis subsp. quintayensis]
MNSPTFFEKHFGLLFFAGLCIGTIFAFVYGEHQILRGDQTQMIAKGYLGAYDNNWLAYGSFASTVGNLPGYLSALVVGLPIMVWDSPWAPMAFLIALRLCAFLMIDAVIKQAFDKPIRLVFLGLFWLSPWVQYDNLMYNPAYLCFFAALHLWTASKMREKSSFLYSFLHILAIGMALQLHFSWPILAVVSVFLFYRTMIKVSWLGVAAGLIVTTLSLIPYFHELMVNETIVEESDRYIGYGLVHVYPVIKSVVYWLRYGSFLFSNRVIANSSFDWVTSIEWMQMVIQYLWKAVTFGFGIASVLISAKFNWRTWKFVMPIIKRDNPIENTESWLILYSFATLTGIVICACLSPITFSYWHLIIAFPFALFPILREIRIWKESNNARFTKIFLISLAYLLTLNLLASNDSQKFSYKVSYQEQVESYLVTEGLSK